MGVWAIKDEKHNLIYYAVWCRRTDELVDGPNAIHMSAEVLDRWEERLHDLFNGRPFDMLDAALTDTVQKFPLDIKVYRLNQYNKHLLKKYMIHIMYAKRSFFGYAAF